MTEGIVPIRELSETEALAWLRDRGRVKMPLTRIAEIFGWNYQRVCRRVSAWQKAKLISRRGPTITVKDTVAQDSAQPVEPTQETPVSFRPNSPTVITITTAQICELAARIGRGEGSRSDLRLADRIISAFVGQFERDSIVQIIVGGEIADDPTEEDDPP